MNVPSRFTEPRQAPSLATILLGQKWHLPGTPDASFDNLADIAAASLNMPVAMVNLISDQSLLVKSAIGASADKISLKGSLCGKVAHSNELMVWSDVNFPTDWCQLPEKHAHQRNFRFYAGAPLHDIDGSVLGTLCVMDFEPRQLHERQREILNGLARQLENLVKMDRLNQSLKQQLTLSDSYQTRLEDLLGAIELASDGIAILGADENYLYLNKAHVEMFGFTKDKQLLGKSWRTLYSKAEVAAFEKDIFPALAEKGYWSGEALATRKDGSQFHEEVSLTALREGGLVCVCRDVSDRVAQQQELLRAKEAADRASEIKSQFIANVSHELRTPLNGIVGLIYLLRNLDHPEKAIEYLDLANTSANSLICLISDLLDFSKIEADKIDYNFEAVELAKILEDARNGVLPLAADKNLPIIIDNQLPGLVVNTDPNRLSQVLKNLLSNAVKFTDEGQIQLLAKSGKGRLLLSVVDTGQGIADEMQPHIFEPFVQDTSIAGSTGGTGLGLSISKRLTRGLGGNLTFKSTPGHGTQFDISLPLGP